MGLLSWALITQQTHSFMQQTEAFGRILVEQLAHSASEPVMAEDHFTLTGLVNRQIGNTQVVSALIRQGDSILAEAGVIPPLVKQHQIIQSKAKQVVWSWHDKTGKERKAITFATPIQFMDVTPGYALITLDRDQLDREQHKAIFILAYTTLGVDSAWRCDGLYIEPTPLTTNPGAGSGCETISRGESIKNLDHLRRDEIGRIISSFNKMVDGIREKGRVERALASYVSPHAAPRILANLEQPAMQASSSLAVCFFVTLLATPS